MFLSCRLRLEPESQKTAFLNLYTPTEAVSPDIIDDSLHVSSHRSYSCHAAVLKMSICTSISSISSRNISISISSISISSISISSKLHAERANQCKCNARQGKAKQDKSEANEHKAKEGKARQVANQSVRQSTS